jgi:hypothetical protein
LYNNIPTCRCESFSSEVNDKKKHKFSILIVGKYEISYLLFFFFFSSSEQVSEYVKFIVRRWNTSLRILDTVVSHECRDLTRYTPLPWYHHSFDYQSGRQIDKSNKYLESAMSSEVLADHPDGTTATFVCLLPSPWPFYLFFCYLKFCKFLTVIWDLVFFLFLLL